MILLACLGSFALAFLLLWWAFKDAEWRLDDRDDYDLTRDWRRIRHSFKGED